MTRTDDPAAQPGPDPARPGRRAVLRTAGLVALAGGGSAVLAACSSTGSTTAPAAGSTASSPAASNPASSSSAGSAPSSATSSAGAAAKGPSIAVADVPVGSGVILPEPEHYVVTQPTKGNFKAFTSICTHQQCPVGEVNGKLIHCKCHGSNFSITTGAPTPDSPAKEPLQEFKVTVSGQQVVLDV